MSSQVKPIYSINKNLDDKEPIEPIAPKNDKITHPIVDPIKVSKEEMATIDLNKDLSEKRKQIGFETESLFDSDWKDIRIEYNKLLFNYSKLSKKNLTGKLNYLTFIQNT